MKVSIGMNLQPGAWGGGNQFGHSLKNYLEDKGCTTFFDLLQSDIDVIVLTDPRPKLKSSAYSDKKIIEYFII